MRLRRLAPLSAFALAALVLAGCSSTGTPDSSVSPSASAAGDLCAAAAAPGAATDAVTIEGDAGAVSEAVFETGVAVEEIQRDVVVEGDGDAIEAGDYVGYALSAFDADTGERIGDLGYTPGEILPSAVTTDSSLAQILGCATVGSRLVVAFPASDAAAAQIYIVDVMDIMPTAAWGEPQEPVEGMPVVTLAEDGTPTMEIPDAAAPAELEIAVLKEGDGEVVADGDTTLLQYYGVDWETGESFDDSWSKGAPISIQGNTYVPGFVQALVGQKVGSQVLVVIPPALGYGEDPEAHELGGKTLVFVIDILATQHPAQ